MTVYKTIEELRKCRDVLADSLNTCNGIEIALGSAEALGRLGVLIQLMEDEYNDFEEFCNSWKKAVEVEEGR